jgi:hypothetical protein
MRIFTPADYKEIVLDKIWSAYLEVSIHKQYNGCDDAACSGYFLTATYVMQFLHYSEENRKLQKKTRQDCGEFMR